MKNLPFIQEKINRLLSLQFGGSYLSNTAKIFFPFIRLIREDYKPEISEIKRYLYRNCAVKSEKSVYHILSDTIRWFGERVDNGNIIGLKTIQLQIPRTYNSANFLGRKFAAVNKLCEYLLKNLDDYLMGAYIHGSLSTIDYTDYSDFDTLFILKNEALEDPKQIEELEKHFITSLRYLFEFDPLQHHGHFFLTEYDLKYYNQSFLPLSSIKLSTSILGSTNNITFLVRDSKRESEERFIESIKTVRRLSRNTSKLKNLYYLKGFLSHFMILPALFLQLDGEYVAKKNSFKILEKRVPPDIWNCMDKVSSIRENWHQPSSIFKRNLVSIPGLWNPFVFPLSAKCLYRIKSIIVEPQLLKEMYQFTEYLMNLSGLDENKLKN